ncbi:DUF2254 domain-containing protein [Salibacterium aidingense]|uniref:DUF2254 domain-containing protein n=1 Tax=Salibacterium aidingense TaxID=384933 RepID=UPI0003F8D25F|nr:DUF2254 domain-containing protein [Salibacterium aidingense]
MSLGSLFNRIRSNFLYVPSLYGIAAFVLALLSVQFDLHMLSEENIYSWVPSSLFIPIDLARTILGSISAALLTMTTITFSTILVVLTTYLSEFSPRTLQNFISDPKTQRVLGFFVAGIIYSILLLLFLQESDSVTYYISPSFAVFFAIICVFMFVFFIHHVSSWIQVSSLLHYITRETMEKIEKDLPDEKDIAPENPWDDWEGEEIKQIEPSPVKAEQAGYIQHIDVTGMIKQAEKDDCIIRVNAKVSEYVEQGAPFLSVWERSTSCNKAMYRNYITQGPEKASNDTVEFALVKMVEIALRALSPGINDPNTAITCITNLGKILARLGRKHLPRAYHHDKDKNIRLILDKPDFAEYLYTCFHQIRQHGFHDISVLFAGIEAFTLIAHTNSDTVKQAVWEFTEYVLEGIEASELLTLDKRYLNHKLYVLAGVCRRSQDFQEL